MKKRIVAFLFSMLLLSTLLGGCKNADNKSISDLTDGKNIEDDNTKTDDTETESSIGDTVVGEDINSDESNTDLLTEASYEYEQDLNIIDDNYRNYYEIFVYSFCDSNSDGIGDFNGIISKLDYISEDLGFNGIWLMPIMPSPSYHKYDLTDYYQVDPQYGSLEDFQNLTAECDKQGIKLIIDFVFNHTSAQHPWFKEAVTYLEGLGEGEEPDLTKCPYVGYYHFTKDYDGAAGFYKVGSSDWYYEGKFWDQMPDLALENTAVRGEIEKAAKYWMDMGVDGFRLDAAKEFFSGETARNIEVLKWFIDYATGVKEDVYIVGEVWDESSVIASYYKSGTMSFFNYPLALYNGEIASAVKKLGSASLLSALKTIICYDKKYRESNPDYIDAPFISNHDNTRISAHYVNNEDQMKMAAGILLTLDGSPFVYYGDEIGMNSLGNKDENKRLPMQWSATDQTGMTNGPNGADDVEQKFAPVDVQLVEPLSILNYYKRAVRIRNENPEIARGRISIIEELSDKDLCAIKKVYQSSEIVLVYNNNSEAAFLSMKDVAYEKLVIRGYLTVDGSVATLVDGVLELPKYSIVILKE